MIEQAPTPSTAALPKQQTTIFKFEDAIKLIDEAASSADPEAAKKALASIKLFCEARLKKVKDRNGDSDAGAKLLDAMNTGRAFKPWTPKA